MNSTAREILAIEAQVDAIAQITADLQRSFAQELPADAAEPEYYRVPVLVDGYSDVLLRIWPDGEAGVLYTAPSGQRVGSAVSSPFMRAVLKSLAVAVAPGDDQ